jgi:hypothetical protein
LLSDSSCCMHATGYSKYICLAHIASRAHGSMHDFAVRTTTLMILPSYINYYYYDETDDI